MTFIILGVFGVLAGITASLFGFGGGFVVVPLLYHLLGANNPSSMHIAVATSTSIMIINSINAAYKHNKNKNIIWHIVFPLIIYIAIGAILGVYLTKFMNDNIIRWCFIAYMIYTIYDCLAKKDFINNTALNIRSLNRYLNFGLGILIGIVATALGVGGSVMTVPLMRRLGAKMKNAVAMANPLSFPVGLVGTIGYTALAHTQGVHLGNYYVGFIYLPAFLFLAVGGLIGVPIGAKLVNKIPDTVHAKIYILLLVIVLVAMLF